MISKLELYGIVLIAVLLAAAGAYAFAKHQGVMEERQRWEAKEAEATAKDLVSLRDAVNQSNAIAGRTLEAVGNIKVVNKTINQEVQREIRTDVRYANDCLPDSGLQLWNAANRGVLPTGGTGSKPPGSRPELPAPR